MKFTFTDIEEDLNVLEEAYKLVTTKRNDDYGHPSLHFNKIAKVWSDLKGINFTASDVAKFMIVIKLCREENKPKKDNRTDIAGYALTLDMVERENKGEYNL